MSDFDAVDLPAGWRTLNADDHSATYVQENGNLRVLIDPRYRMRGRHRMGDPRRYVVEVETTTGQPIIGLDADTIKCEDPDTAREQALAFMQSFTRNREAVEVEDIDTGDGDTSGGSGKRSDADRTTPEPEPGVDEAEAGTGPGSGGSWFDEAGATEAVADRDRRAAVRALLDVRGYSDEILIRELRRATGDALRAVVHFDDGEYTDAYVREDLEGERDRVERFHGEMRFVSRKQLQRPFGEAGDLLFLAAAYEQRHALRFMYGPDRDTVITLDREAGVDEVFEVAADLQHILARRAAG